MSSCGVDDLAAGSDVESHSESATQTSDVVMLPAEPLYKPPSSSCVSVRDPRAQNR